MALPYHALLNLLLYTIKFYSKALIDTSAESSDDTLDREDICAVNHARQLLYSKSRNLT